MDEASKISNVELVYCKVLADEADIMFVSSSVLVTNNIILKSGLNGSNTTDISS